MLCLPTSLESLGRGQHAGLARLRLLLVLLLIAPVQCGLALCGTAGIDAKATRRAAIFSQLLAQLSCQVAMVKIVCIIAVLCLPGIFEGLSLRKHLSLTGLRFLMVLLLVAADQCECDIVSRC